MARRPQNQISKIQKEICSELSTLRDERDARVQVSAPSSSLGRYRPRPSPDPDKEISTIRLFCRLVLRSVPDLHFDPGRWKGVSSEELLEPFPGHTRSLTSSVEPLPPRSNHGVSHALQRSKVAVYPEVVVVPHQLARERSMLLLDWAMPMTSTPLSGGVDCPPEARTTSPECHPPRSPPRPLPVQREAEKVEGRATP